MTSVYQYQRYGNGYYSSRSSSKPTWLTLYKCFQAFSLLSLILGFIFLGVYGCPESQDFFHKAWATVEMMQALLALFMVISGGNCLIAGIFEVKNGLDNGEKIPLDCGMSKMASYSDFGHANEPFAFFSSKEPMKDTHFSILVSAGVSQPIIRYELEIDQ